VILIVQRQWVITQALVTAFEALGARTLATTDAGAALTLVDASDLSAAILDSKSDALCTALKQRNSPFVLYTGQQEVPDDCATAPLIEKPAPTNEVVAKVEQLFR
jgi:DNA-binding response OmpR family regulator